MSRIFTTAFAALQLARSVYGLGQVEVVNKCPFNVNLWSVSNVQGPVSVLNSNGGSWTQQYQYNSNGGGISIKITPDASLSDPITQLEYTVTDLLWYDISNINGDPFLPHGLSLIPSDSSCGSVTCMGGDACGDQIYLEPDDDFAVKACNSDANLLLTLCTDMAGSPEPAPEPAPSPSPEPVNDPTPVMYTTPIIAFPTAPGYADGSPDAPLYSTTTKTAISVITVTTFVTHVVTVAQTSTVVDIVTAASGFRAFRA